jgi:hypothetical protein
MAEITQLVFTHKEVATALIKAHGLHEGIWGLYIKFGITGANVGMTATDLQPAAIVPVLEIGLQKFEEENNIAVDAARVNPAGGIPKNVGQPPPRASDALARRGQTPITPPKTEKS